MLQSIKYTIIFINVLLYTNNAAHFDSAAIFCRLFICFASLFWRESAVEGIWFVVGTGEFIYLVVVVALPCRVYMLYY